MPDSVRYAARRYDSGYHVEDMINAQLGIDIGTLYRLDSDGIVFCGSAPIIN